MILPKTVVKAETKNPRKLLIYARPKAGKTSAIIGLDNYLLIDLEEGSSLLDAVKVKARSLEELIEVGKAIKAENETTGTKVYKYIVLDTVSRMEELSWQLALKNYKNSLVGKNFTGDTNAFKQLPKGAGYPLTLN